MVQALLSPIVAAWLAAPTVHGQVHVQSQEHEKADRSGVVVFVADQALPPGRRPEAIMRQSGRAFEPPVLAIPVGTTVHFPNLDPIEHNVFSRSPHAAFDLGRYGRGGSKTYTFEQAGVVDVYCNVHSNMVGHVVVVPGPWAVTGADGSFAIAGVSPGPHQLVAWDRLGAPAIQRQTVDVSASGEGSVDLKFVEPSDMEAPHPNKFGGAYHDKKY